MQKIILIFLLSLSSFSYSFAENWQDQWSQSVLLMEKGQFAEAKPLLDLSISSMEENADNNQPHLYIDRARLNILLKFDDCVLADLEKALSSEKLTTHEKIRALTTKLMFLGSLGIVDSLSDDLKAFSELVNLPVLELKDSKLIIRNAPNNEYYKNMMTCYLIHCGLCYDKEDFVWLKSGMLVAEKINHCGCQKCITAYAQTRKCQNCLNEVSPTIENISLENLIIAWMQYCGEEVKQLDDQIACLKALVNIQNCTRSVEVFEHTFDGIFHEIDKSTPIFWD